MASNGLTGRLDRLEAIARLRAPAADAELGAFFANPRPGPSGRHPGSEAGPQDPGCRGRPCGAEFLRRHAGRGGDSKAPTLPVRGSRAPGLDIPAGPAERAHPSHGRPGA